MGQLIPVVCQQVVPGDRFRCGLTYQMQLAPMLNPVYDGLEVNFEAFFVPNRILDPKWREFWTGYNEYDQTTAVDISPLMMYVQVNRTQLEDVRRSINAPFGIGSLLDFLGVQFAHYNDVGLPVTAFESDTIIQNTPLINAYPVLAYNRIYDDWYRNERTQRASLYDYYNISDPSVRILSSRFTYNPTSSDMDGVDTWVYESQVPNSIPCQLHYRNYKKDPFTTALPEPIVGGDVRIPTGESFDTMNTLLLGTTTIGVEVSSSGTVNQVVRNQKTSGGDGISLNALALGTIQQLKLALKEYSYRMKDTYNGNRYVESLYAHYGVVVPDSTLQRSIYLGSARDYVNFGEVYQTSSGDGEGSNGALGDYAGRGAANGTHYLFDESFYECGFFFVLMSVSPRSRYFQGIKRMFTRVDRADYFSPEYQNIGDDFLETSELTLSNDMWDDITSVDPYPSVVRSSVFGYNSRWIDMKYRYDELHGEFARPDSPMFNWNFSRSLSDSPRISPEFSQITPINKPFVDLSSRNDNYFVDVAVKLDALRPVLSVESF